MESNKFGYWLQIGANVGILAGLVLVSLQISQNTNLTRLGFYSAEEDSFIAMGATLSGETLAIAWAKAIEEPESLTTAEMVQLEGYLQNVWTQIARREYLYREGLYELSGEETISWVAKQRFGNRFSQAWWQEKRKEVAVNDSRNHILEAMDRAIAELDDDTQAQKFSDIRRTIQERAPGAAE